MLPYDLFKISWPYRTPLYGATLYCTAAYSSRDRYTDRDRYTYRDRDLDWGIDMDRNKDRDKMMDKYKDMDIITHIHHNCLTVKPTLKPAQSFYLSLCPRKITLRPQLNTDSSTLNTNTVSWSKKTELDIL